MKRCIVPALAALFLLAGCGMLRTDCSKPGPYATAESIPPLLVPPGLEAPDTRRALRIPELKEPERPRAPGDACLDAPPSYKVERARPSA